MPGGREGDMVIAHDRKCPGSNPEEAIWHRLPVGTWLIQEGAKLALEDEDVVLPSRKDTRPIPFSDED